MLDRCPLCQGKVVLERVKDYVYDTNLGDIVVQGESEIPRCSECRELFVPGELMDRWNKELLRQMSRRKAPLSAKELVFVFSVLPYSQAELATALGRTRSALTKYKKGENPIDRAVDHTLKEIIEEYSQGKERLLRRLLDDATEGTDTPPPTYSLAAKAG